jgi:ornithine cyclodeaminase/alanine dehydrogenase-like protein (mu-crystallin family)
VLILSRVEVEALLSPTALLDAVSAGLQAVSANAFSAAPRQSVEADGGAMLTMSGRQVDGPVVVKLVGVFAGNVALGLEPHPAVITLFDATTGACLALMDGEHITGLRTAAAAALSTRALAREDASVLAVVGSGVQARAHLRMLPLVRPFSSVRLVARDPGAAERLGVEPGTIEGADVICLTTSSGTPVVAADEVAPGTHVTSVGFAPPGGELDPALARAGGLFVESRVAFEPPPAGCAELAGLDAAVGTELGDVLAGRAPGRTSPSEITVYKAMGHVAEDAAAAELVYRTALEAGAGTHVDL